MFTRLFFAAIFCGVCFSRFTPDARLTRVRARGLV
jgi:hypothetical protein